MSSLRAPITILLAEDDPDDQLLIIRALKRSNLANPVKTVNDGEELMDYLYRRGNYSDPENSPRPGLILLDLNMPRKDGREALREIKADPDLRRIPVVALTTSDAEEDIVHTYDLGINAFITKPVTLNDLVRVVRNAGEFWFEIVTLPPERS